MCLIKVDTMQNGMQENNADSRQDAVSTHAFGSGLWLFDSLIYKQFITDFPTKPNNPALEKPIRIKTTNP